jgi:transcriptional regulator with XRE-family HTH domain
MMTIRGDRLKSLRKKRQWTQPQVLERVRAIVGPGRLARNTLSEIENDRYESEPGGWLLEALAQVFETSIDYLVGLTDDPGLAIPNMPVPEPDIAELVDRLNRLPEGLRREVATLVAGAVELAERLARGVRPQLAIREGQVAYDVDARAAALERLVRLLESLSEDQQREVYEDLAGRFGERRDAAGL